MPITVLIVNHAPVVTPIADITLTAGQPFDQAVMATDPDGNPIKLSVANGIAGYPLPGFVTLTDNGGGSGVLHFNPPAGNRGTYTLTLSATDDGDGLGAAGVHTGSYTFVVTVQSPTQLPVIDYIGNKVAVIGQPFALNIHASEADQDNLTYCRLRPARRRDPDARDLVRDRDAQLDAHRGRRRRRTASPSP